MRILGELEKCRLYIESHAVNNGMKKKGFPTGPCITVSRETGTSAKLVCEELIKFFNEKNVAQDSPEWTIFDKNLIEKVLDDHKLPDALKELMAEEKISFFSSMLNEMFSGLPGQWTLIHKTSETVLRLASLGYSIIIGRGGNVITSHLNNTFHVRLIAPLNERIKNFAGRYCLDYKSAQTIVEQHDQRRKKYLYSVFNRKIDDPFSYNLVINTRGMEPKQVASIIGSAVIDKFPKMLKRKTDFSLI